MTLALQSWLQTARPGDRCEYHRGFLAVDAPAPTSSRAWWAADDVAVDEIRALVVNLYLTGNYELAQHRIGPSLFAYFIIKRLTHDPEPRFWYRGGADMFKSVRPHRPLRIAA